MITLVSAAILLTIAALALLVLIPLGVRIAEMQRHGPAIVSNDPNDWHSQASIDEVKR